MSNLLEINNSLNSIIELIEEFDGSIIDATNEYNSINNTNLTEDEFVELFNTLEQDKLSKVKAYILKSKELKTNVSLFKDMQDKYKANVNKINNTLDFMKNNLLVTMKNSKDEKIKTDVGTVYIKNTESVELKDRAKELIEDALQDNKELNTEAISLNYNLTINEVTRLLKLLLDNFEELLNSELISKLYSKFEIELDKKLAKEELNIDRKNTTLQDNIVYPHDLYSISKNQSIVGL